MKLRNKRAFTLIEILMTTVILGVALLAIASAFSRGTSMVTLLKEESVAAYAVQEQMEVIRRTSFSNVLILYFPNANFNTAGLGFLNNSSGAVLVDYPFGVATPNDRIIRVTATVTWTSANGRVRTKSGTTFVTDGGINGT